MVSDVQSEDVLISVDFRDIESFHGIHRGSKTPIMEAASLIVPNASMRITRKGKRLEFHGPTNTDKTIVLTDKNGMYLFIDNKKMNIFITQYIT